MGNFYMESTQINYRRDEKLKTVDQKLQELSETSAIDTDIAPVFKSTNTYQPGDMVYYRNKLYVFNVEHTGTWAAADVTATDVTTTMNAGLNSLKSGLTNVTADVKLNTQDLTTESRTRNLYDKNSEYVLTYINTDTGVMYTSSNATCVYIKCKPNTTYTVSKMVGARFMVATTRVKPANDVQTYGFIVDFEASSITITTDADAKYLVAYVWTNNDEPITREQMLDTVQIEYGSTATTYQQYIESVNARIESVEKPSNIIAILTAGANVSASVLGVILPKDVQTATITRVIPLGGSSVDVNLPLTVTNYDYESRGVIDGSASAVGSDTLLNIAREYCTQVNISLTY